MVNKYCCTRCGKGKNIITRFGVCAAYSYWQKNNSPLGMTTFWTTDDMKIWKLSLCSSCFPDGYKAYLKAQIRRAFKRILTFLGVLIVCGLGGLLLLSLFQEFNFVYIFFAIFCVISVIGIVINTGICMVNALKLYNLRKEGIVPRNFNEKCFIGEGERIILVLENKKPKEGAQIFGEFTLPQFTEHDNLRLPPKEKEKVFKTPSDKDRRIGGIRSTLDDLERDLNKELKPFWSKALDELNA